MGQPRKLRHILCSVFEQLLTSLDVAQKGGSCDNCSTSCVSFTPVPLNIPLTLSSPSSGTRDLSTKRAVGWCLPWGNSPSTSRSVRCSCEDKDAHTPGHLEDETLGRWLHQIMLLNSTNMPTRHTNLIHPLTHPLTHLPGASCVSFTPVPLNIPLTLSSPSSGTRDLSTKRAVGWCLP